MPTPFLDGNWLDICTALTGAIWAFAKCKKRIKGTNIRFSVAFFGKTTATDFASGMSIFPLFILAMALFSTLLLRELLSENRLILTIAGLTALLGTLEDF